MSRIIKLLLCSTLLLSCRNNQVGTTDISKEQLPETKVKLCEVKTSNDSLNLNYNGLIEPITRVPLSFQLPGTVIKIAVDEGDRVRKGQILAEIDKTSYQSAYNAAIATQQQAQDAYNRMKKVYDNGSLPEIKWEDVKSKLEQANSSAQIAKKNLEDCVIKSPIDGTVSDRSIEAGASATPNLTCLQVFSTDGLYAKISVPGNEINRIEKGQKATVTIPGLNELTYDSEADKIAASADAIAKTFEVKFKLQTNSTELKPGMICNVKIPLATESAPILIPIQAVMKDAHGQNYVFLVDKQEKIAKQQVVKTGGIINNMLCIRAGLHTGDWFVVEGQHKLTNNDRVNFN